jgi:hypothetical protein
METRPHNVGKIVGKKLVWKPAVKSKTDCVKNWTKNSRRMFSIPRPDATDKVPSGNNGSFDALHARSGNSPEQPCSVTPVSCVCPTATLYMDWFACASGRTRKERRLTQWVIKYYLFFFSLEVVSLQLKISRRCSCFYRGVADWSKAGLRNQLMSWLQGFSGPICFSDCTKRRSFGRGYYVFSYVLFGIGGVCRYILQSSTWIGWSFLTKNVIGCVSV